MRSMACIAFSLSLSCALVAPAVAQTPLAEAFAAAWQRQPAALALAERQRAAERGLVAAEAWFAEPPSVELAARSDRFNRQQGASEQEIAFALPLWLPGERAGRQALARAEQVALSAGVEATRLALAEQVRERWWAWQLAVNERQQADGRRRAAQGLRDDVDRRFQAGDLSRADLNQAEGALALAIAQQAENVALEGLALARLAALSGDVPSGQATRGLIAEPLPTAPQATRANPGNPGNTVNTVNTANPVNPADAAQPGHPLLAALDSRRALASRAADLARTQSRANPELALGTRFDRAGQGAAPEQTWALALRIPLGAGARHEARVATANAEAIEAQVAFEREQERLARETRALRRQVEAAAVQRAAAETRARLARDNQGFFEKSFRLGESDLPTRLRIDAEAYEAERALGRARVVEAAAISQLRQQLGLLPE